MLRLVIPVVLDYAATGDIVVGKDANINNYASQGGSIAIGKNAKIGKYGRRCRG